MMNQIHCKYISEKTRIDYLILCDCSGVYENPLFAQDNVKTFGPRGWESGGNNDDDMHFTEEDEKMFEKY